MVISAENDAGWAGSVLERADYFWYRNGKVAQKRTGTQLCDRPPSEYFKQNIRLTFMRDHTAVLARDVIGVETLMWGNDFPHHVSTWPRSKEVLAEHFDTEPDEVRRQIVCDNVRQLYRF